MAGGLTLLKVFNAIKHLANTTAINNAKCYQLRILDKFGNQPPVNWVDIRPKGNCFA